MSIQFTLDDLFYFTGGLLLFIIGILLIVLLVKLIGVLSRANKILVENKDNINRSLTALPETLENTKDITGDIKSATEQVKEAVPVVLDDIETITGTARDSVEMAGEVILDIGEGIDDTVNSLKGKTPRYASYVSGALEIVELIYQKFLK